ncbi:methionine ABC transporter ATP-binding protein MetN [Moraxella sp. FZLJ2107]|uniref:methionine ABC transporter ATP-binding protein MetN n=1 Tax=unclassified Moraxella TaxID=2685852 RepID=UPI0020C918D9|nr:methionine ABC transporter ATP-binding protein MetN [Moraxella sp. FZLJ2107]UTO23450.1 methionine ABC transporter ATP-binding protein MetN [Moraxella sp. FZLJ2109]
MIELHGVKKQFTIEKDGKTSTFTAVQPTDLTIKQGEIYGIIGSSGAGKSTLIRCVNLLERPTTGRVIIDGIELTALSEQDLIIERRNIGMIFQHFNLLHSRTAFDNIALPLELSGTPKSVITTKVNGLLELVGLSDKKDAYPANLSGGQKQRVAIARALASDPKVLLCDEATSALDPATTQSILKLLKQINQQLGITILLITHEMDVVKRICDKVAVIDQGVLIEQGTVSEIFANPQTELAKEFIRSTFHIGLPDDYLSKLHSEPSAGLHPLVKFEFTGNSVDMPLFSQATKQFGVEFSILTSQMDYAGGVKFGFTIAEVIGDADSQNRAMAYLTDHHVNVEVLGYVG